MLTLVNSEEYYPTGFYIDNRRVTVSFASFNSFVPSYAPSSYTIPLYTHIPGGDANQTSTQWIQYWDEMAYATVYDPSYRVKTNETVTTKTNKNEEVKKSPNVGKPKSTPIRNSEEKVSVDDELSLFYADLGTSIIADAKQDPREEENKKDQQESQISIPSKPKVQPEPVRKEQTSLPDTASLSKPKLTPGPNEDYANLDLIACLLCERQFKSVEDLRKHGRKSSLHASNLKNPDKIQLALERKYTHVVKLPAPTAKKPARNSKTEDDPNYAFGIGSKLLQKM